MCRRDEIRDERLSLLDVRCNLAVAEIAQTVDWINVVQIEVTLDEHIHLRRKATERVVVQLAGPRVILSRNPESTG